MADAAAPQSLAESLDAAIASFFASHNPFTWILIGIITIFLVYPLFMSSDPDIHPFLLARQATAAPIRNSGESPVYRALDVPHGYPLRSSLGVKDPGAPKWTSGRQGDVRDVLARAVRGPLNANGDGYDASKVGKLLTLTGKDQSTATEMKELMRLVNAAGLFLKSRIGGADGKVAVCLSNGVEMLACIFGTPPLYLSGILLTRPAAAYYDFSVTLIPPGLAQEDTDSLLKQIDVKVLIAEAGELDLDSALPKCKSLEQVVLVAKPDSQHMDWASTPVPKGVSVTTWHDLTTSTDATSEVPTYNKDSPKPRPIGTFFMNHSTGKMELVEYTTEVTQSLPSLPHPANPPPQNLVSGTAALLPLLPRTSPLTHTDTLLPILPLTTSYALCWTLAALYSNATLSLTSITAPSTDIFTCLAASRPTILITGPGTWKHFLKHYTHTGLGASRFAKFWQRRSLAQGIMPGRKPVPDLSGKDAVFLVMELAALGDVRGVFVGEDAGERKGERLTDGEVAELRVELGVRVSKGLVDGRVAGAVCQGNLLDYRIKANGKGVGLGAPVGSVEVKLVGEEKIVGPRDGRGKVSSTIVDLGGGCADLCARLLSGGRRLWMVRWRWRWRRGSIRITLWCCCDVDYRGEGVRALNSVLSSLR